MKICSLKGTVEFEQVSKRYQLGSLGTLRNAVSTLLSRSSDADNWRRILWALRDVNFQVEPGEALGLIGPNGAGKTTSLKLLSNITKPTTGKVAVHGRVSSLIELGAGFHPELTGRENIYLNGAILGLNRREIARKLDAIIAFSELERFIDTPVKRYSSGMYVRLGFAVAAHVEADVLLIDEVLAVGDSAFRQKCLDSIEKLRQLGTTIIFVSHNMYQVRRLCTQVLLLIEGKCHFLGNVGEAIATYERLSHSSNGNKGAIEPPMSDTPGTIIIPRVILLDEDEQPVSRLRHDQTLIVRSFYHTHYPIIDPIIKVRLIRSDGTVCAMTASQYQPNLAWTLVGQGTITVYFKPIQLLANRYTVEVRIIDTTDSTLLASGQSDWIYVDSPGFMHELDRGVFVPNVHWVLG